jgi:hypothetical protein
LTFFQPARFNLDTAALQFQKFRECLAGSARDDWDLAWEDHPAMIDGFNETLCKFIHSFLVEEYFYQQKVYPQQAKKPFKLAVKDHHQHLKTIVLFLVFLSMDRFSSMMSYIIFFLSDACSMAERLY